MHSSFLSTPGEHYQGFVVTKIVPIDELQCTLRELVHEASGATVMHIENDDPENLFCLSFKTHPDSSNGVAHILEHTVLCGSRKYPVKDPFFAMRRRSLHTFMNALTGSDFTCYPAASQVEKDFYNLLDVYLDAVFHPELKELSFLQEGHRLEFTQGDDPSTPLVRKGIVYNEMKGNMASPDSRLWRELLACLMPDLTYGNNSGGNPKDIPNLSYAELLKFHETFYNPSRCLFFFYGNFPLKKHLDVIEEKALAGVSKKEPIPPIPLQKRFAAPLKKEISYPVAEGGDLSEKNIVSFAYLTAPVSSQQELLALAVIDSILMDTDASPLKSHLLKSNLCISVHAYMDMEMSEVPYAIVCKGCKHENIDKLETCLKEGLEKIIREGIPRYLIDAAIHQIEFSRTEISGDGHPFGLTLFMRSGLAKQHGCSAENVLTMHALFEQLFKDIGNPNYLTDLIRKYFIDNTHFVRLVLRPDPQLSARETEEEKQHLKNLEKQLSQNDIKKILLQTKDLANYQKLAEKQELDCLPKVGIEDVPLFIRDFSLAQDQKTSLTTFHHACFTNHILYAELVFDLPQVSQEDLPYVQLLLSILPEIGCADRSYVENLEYIQAHTGGIRFAFSLHTQINPEHPPKPALHIRGKALSRKIDKLLPLMLDHVTAARFDEKQRIAEVLEQIRSNLENRIQGNASRYAIHLAQSGLSSAALITNLCHGLGYYEAIQRISKCKIDDVIATLSRIYHEVFCNLSPHLVLSCDDDLFSEIEKNDFFGLQNLAHKPSHRWKNNFQTPQVSSQGRLIASPVAFNAEAFVVPSLMHPDSPALYLAAELFKNLTLHPVIREQGGAYGSGASYSPLLGHFAFHSYRDPHILSSREAFHSAVHLVADKKFSKEHLEEAKLSVIQNFDAPIAPEHRGITAYVWWREGRSPAFRQHFRDALLNMKAEDVAQAVKSHIIPKLEATVFVSFASKENLEAANQELVSKGETPMLLLPV